MNDEEIVSLNRMKLFSRSSDLSVVSAKDMDIVVNLVEKQQKEIEKLNKSDTSKEQSSMEYYNLYKELEDKIKAKIEELNNKLKNADEIEAVFIIKQQQVLQSLLEDKEE